MGAHLDLYPRGVGQSLQESGDPLPVSSSIFVGRRNSPPTQDERMSWGLTLEKDCCSLKPEGNATPCRSSWTPSQQDPFRCCDSKPP